MDSSKQAKPPEPPSRRPAARWVGLALLVAAGIVALVVVGEAIGDLATRLVRGAAARDRTLMAHALAAAFTFAAAMLPIPIEAPALLNGGLFPPVRAFTLTWTFAMAGCAASYEIGRWLGRAPAARVIGPARMARVERLLDRAGWPTLLALRLSPVMAFTALNWVSGVLALSRPVFYWTTAAGVVPGTFVFTVTPYLLRERSSTWLLVGVGFAVALGLLALSYLRVRRIGGTEAD